MPPNYLYLKLEPAEILREGMMEAARLLSIEQAINFAVIWGTAGHRGNCLGCDRTLLIALGCDLNPKIARAATLIMAMHQSRDPVPDFTNEMYERERGHLGSIANHSDKWVRVFATIGLQCAGLEVHSAPADIQEAAKAQCWFESAFTP